MPHQKTRDDPSEPLKRWRPVSWTWRCGALSPEVLGLILICGTEANGKKKKQVKTMSSLPRFFPLISGTRFVASNTPSPLLQAHLNSDVRGVVFVAQMLFSWPAVAQHETSIDPCDVALPFRKRHVDARLFLIFALVFDNSGPPAPIRSQILL